jgi:hypothetical protein
LSWDTDIGQEEAMNDTTTTRHLYEVGREVRFERLTVVLDGRLQEERSPELVAEMLDALEAEEEGFEADELSEEGKTLLNDGTYSFWACISNAALAPLRHHSLLKLRFRHLDFSETSKDRERRRAPKFGARLRGLW